MKNTILALALTSILGQANAQVFRTYEVPFNPDRVQALGLGYDALDKEDRGIECIEKNVIDLDTATNLSSKMSSTLVTSHRELLRTMDIGMNMSADMSFAELFSAEGSFSAHYHKTFKLKEDEISFVLYLSQDYGRKAIVNPVLKPSYQALIDNKDYDTFRELCGTHYYNMKQNKSYVVAMIKISGLSKETKESIDASYSSTMEMDAFDFSATFSASYNKLMTEINKLATVSIDFFSIGGSGIVKLTDVISNADTKDIKVITQALANYAETMTAANAAPAKFNLNLYPGYPADTTKLSFREKSIINELVKNSQEGMDKVQSLLADEGEVKSRYSNYLVDYLYSQIEKNEKMVLECIAYDNCNLLRPREFEVVTKEDSLKDIKLNSRCEYSAVNGTNYISKLQLRLDAKLYFPERVQYFEVLEQSNGTLKKLSTPYDLNLHLASRNTSTYFEADLWYKRLYASLSTNHFPQITRGGSSDVEKIHKRIKELKEKVYWLKMYYKDSEVLVKLGRVDMRNCPISR